MQKAHSLCQVVAVIGRSMIKSQLSESTETLSMALHTVPVNGAANG